MSMTPEERRAYNLTLTDYQVCEKLIINTNSPLELRQEWMTEAQRRDVDCNEYAATINAVRALDKLHN